MSKMHGPLFSPLAYRWLHALQLLEEFRVMHIREVILRLDQANKGMLDCLLGSWGPVETLSASLSRVDSLEDIQTLVRYVRKRAGLSPLPSIDEYSPAAAEPALNEEERKIDNEEDRPVAREPSAGDGGVGESNIGTHKAQMMTGLEVLDLAEDGLEGAFEGAREGTDEAARMAHEMCSCIAEVGIRLLFYLEL